MKSILQSNNLIVFLLLIGTSCIARTLKNQFNPNDRLHSFIHKYSTINIVRDAAEGTIDICPNHVSGSLVVSTSETLYASVLFDATMNLSNIDDDCHFHHYSGNITMTIDPNNVYNHRTTPNLTPNGVHNYTITISVDMCRNRFIFNVTSCDDCDLFVLKGFYQAKDSNSTCTEFDIGAFSP